MIPGMDTTQALIMARIKRSLGGGRDALGAVVTPKDFLDLAGRPAVDQALGRLVRAGVLARVGRGLYHLPRVNPMLGIAVPPDPDAVAAAIGRQSGSPVAPSGAVVANRLGLSTQISAKPVYVTTGRSRTVRVGNQTFRFKRVSPRRLPNADPAVTRALQALHGAGPDPDEVTIDAVRAMLTPRQRRDLAKHAKYDAAWVADSARRIAQNAAKDDAELEQATRG
jgi:hypothetical protein